MISMVQNPTVIREYAGSTSYPINFSYSGIQEGDLLMAFCCNGNAAAGSGEVVSGPSGNFTVGLAPNGNGKTFFYKKATAADIGGTFSLTSGGANEGLSICAAREAEFSPRSIQQSVVTSMAADIKDVIAMRGYYSKAGGDFTFSPTANSYVNLEWKFFTAGQTLQTFNSDATGFHNTIWPYIILEQGVPPNDPPLPPQILNDNKKVISSRGSVVLNWVHEDIDLDAQDGYIIRGRKQ